MNESNEFVIFEEYTKYTCKKIMSVRKRKEVREELYSHLLEEYDRNFSLGMDDLSAQQKAIKKMGDKDSLADAFGKMYSINPTEYMRSSVNYIIWGFLLTHFNIGLFEWFSEITTFLGQALLLFGLFKLRKTDKRFNKALYLYICLRVVAVVGETISYNLPNSNDFETILGIFSSLVTILLFWWIFSGLKSLCETIIMEDDNPPHLFAGFISYFLFSSNIVAAVIFEASELAFFSPILLIFSTVQLCRAKNILAHDEPEFELNNTLLKSEKIVYWILVIIFAITPIIAMIYTSASSPDYEVFNAINTSVSQSEVETAKKKMLELGFPEEYLKDITDTEIIQYIDATYMQTEEIENIHREEYDFKSNVINEIEICKIETFRFYFPDDELRILMRVEFPDQKTFNFRNGLYLQFYDKSFIPKHIYTDNEINYGKYEIVLAELNGETISSTPLSHYTPESSLSSLYIAGFEFKFANGSTKRRAYLAHSAIISKPEMLQNACTDGVLYWEEIPINADYKSLNSMAVSEFDGIFSFGRSGFDTIHRWELYDSFEYDPSFKVKDESLNEN